MEKSKLTFFILSCLLLTGAALNAQVSPVFRLADNSETGILFSNNITETETRNIMVKGMPYYYAGGGAGIIDVNNDGLQDIFLVGNQVESRLYLNKGGLKFEDVTNAMGIHTSEWCTGVLIADVNGDGWQDIYILKAQNGGKETGGNLLYINKNGKTFKEESEAYKLNLNDRFIAGSFFDYDQDGDMDLYLARYPDNSVFGNDINFDFYRTYEPGYGTDILLENKQNKSFKDVTTSAGILKENGFGISVITADFNNDNLTDIYVGNDFAERDYLYLNQGNKTFKECLKDYFHHTSFFTMGLDFQDVNNDALPDLISLDMNPPSLEKYKLDFSSFDYEIYKATQKNYYLQEIRNCLQIQNQDFSFSEIGQIDKIAFTDWSWSPLCADFNLDGYKDLFVTNGLRKDILNQNIYMYELDSMLKSKNIGWENVTTLEVLSYLKPSRLFNYFFENRQKNKFSDVTAAWVSQAPGVSTGAALADLDNDGDLDIITNNIDTLPFIYINQTIENQLSSFIGFRSSKPLKGSVKVRIYSSGGSQYQEIYTVKGFQSSSEPSAVFGLPQGESVDSALISVNQDLYTVGTLQAGRYYYIEDLLKNKTIRTARNPDAISVTDTLARFPETAPFNDFKHQPLLLKRVFPTHPIVRELDCNSDGLPDYYVGKYYGHKPYILVNAGNGEFVQKQVYTTTSDSMQIDADLVTIKTGEINQYLVSYIHVTDSTSKGLRLLQVSGDRAELLNSSIRLNPVSNIETLTYDGQVYYICFGATGLDTYPRSYKSYVLTLDKENVPSVDEKRTTQLNNVLKSGNISSAISYRQSILYTGEFNTINELKFDPSGNLTSSVLFAEKGFWNSLNATKDLSQVIVSNISENLRFNLQFEDSIGVVSKDIDGNKFHDILFAVYQQGTPYTIYAYKELLGQFPKVRRNVFDLLKYKSADLVRVFADPSVVDGMQVATTLKTVRISDKKITESPIQFTTINTMAETPDYLVLGGNNSSLRPDIGNIDAGSIIIQSKSNPDRYRVFNQYFKEVNYIARLGDTNRFLIESENGIYVIEIPFDKLNLN